MAKSNRESKKPKKEKIKTIAAAPSQKGAAAGKQVPRPYPARRPAHHTGASRDRLGAPFDPAPDVPVVIQQPDGVAGVDLLLLRVELVNDDIVGPLERSAFGIDEAAAHLVEFVEFDAGGHERRLDGMIDNPDGQLNVRLLLQVVDHLLGQRCAAER